MTGWPRQLGARDAGPRRRGDGRLPLVSDRPATGRRALAGLALGLFSSAAASQAAVWPTPYEQVGIAVAVSDAPSGVAARDEAYRTALRRGWLRLTLALGQPLVRATDRQIGEMVAAILVEQERVLPHGYRGRLTVRFSPQRVAAVAGIAQPEPELPPEDPEGRRSAAPDMAATPGPAEDDSEASAPPAPGSRPGSPEGQAPFWFRW